MRMFRVGAASRCRRARRADVILRALSPPHPPLMQRDREVGRPDKPAQLHFVRLDHSIDKRATKSVQKAAKPFDRALGLPQTCTNHSIPVPWRRQQ
jgi:hypothetical protein